MFPSYTREERIEILLKKIANSLSSNKNYHSIDYKVNSYQDYLQTCVKPKYYFFEDVKYIANTMDVDWGVALHMYQFETGIKIDSTIIMDFLEDVKPRHSY